MGRLAKKKRTIVLIATFILIGLICGVILIFLFRSELFEEDAMNSSPSAIANSSVSDADIVPVISGSSDSIDIAEANNSSIVAAKLLAAKSRCSDVYAWISIPGTDIDYPISYCDAIDPFYWNHDIDGNIDENGMIITDSLNSMDFSDHMTLIYGKNPQDGTMFSPLHKYSNREFFDKHNKIIITTADSELEYTVFATYLYPNVQILQKYRFEDPLSFTEYFDSLKDIRDLSMQIDEDCLPNYEDYVITLVTHCDDENKRLFVQAVLDSCRTDSKDSQ